METNGAVQEYYSLSKKYLLAAQGNLDQGLYEPALAAGIHALELGIKAMLHMEIDGPIKTHNVGGLLGKHFRETLGDDICKRVNLIHIKYNIPRYPGMVAPRKNEVSEDLAFINDLIRVKFSELIRLRIDSGV